MRCVCFKITIVGTILALLVDGDTGDNVSNSKGCSNFTFLTTEDTFLPSQIINISSSCSMTTECPNWNIISQPAEIKILQNDTEVTDQTCTRNMSIQVVNFGMDKKRIQLLVDFWNPGNEPTRIIYVEKSDSGENCYLREDCYDTDQICSASWNDTSQCSCPSQFVFVRNLSRCYPEIARFYGQCAYSDQCRAYNSLCKDSTCQCPDHHIPDEYFFNCLPDSRSLEEECAIDANCQNRDVNSWCIHDYCACKSAYVNVNGVCQPSDMYTSGSTRIHSGWLGILVTVYVMFSRA